MTLRSNPQKRLSWGVESAKDQLEAPRWRFQSLELPLTFRTGTRRWQPFIMLVYHDLSCIIHGAAFLLCLLGKRRYRRYPPHWSWTVDIWRFRYQCGVIGMKVIHPFSTPSLPKNHSKSKFCRHRKSCPSRGHHGLPRYLCLQISWREIQLRCYVMIWMLKTALKCIFKIRVTSKNTPPGGDRRWRSDRRRTGAS